MFEKLTIEKYNEVLSSKAPTPGGGSALATVGAIACSLVEMAINVTVAKLTSDNEYYDYLQSESKIVNRAKSALYRLSNDDAAAFEQIIAARKLPKMTEDEAKHREIALQKAYHNAALVPLDVMRVCSDLLTRSELRILPHLSKYVSSDCVIAIDLFKTIIRNSSHNVYANTTYITSPELKALLERQCEEILQQIKQ
ncbi:MAG: cyclodeaminase/cyclohydrolase family protein [Clostridiales bacterium]|nr:cyclodeaminase/cyclohydrolase family protein [Clostridiales bacterium]